MMPLMFANPGDEVIIKKVGGSAETKKHLEYLKKLCFRFDFLRNKLK